jgi:hypothetical protein
MRAALLSPDLPGLSQATRESGKHHLSLVGKGLFHPGPLAPGTVNYTNRSGSSPWRSRFHPFRGDTAHGGARLCATRPGYP